MENVNTEAPPPRVRKKVYPVTEQRSYTPPQIAQRNNCSVAKVYRDITLGKLKAHRLGGDGPFRVLTEDETRWVRGERPITARKK